MRKSSEVSLLVPLFPIILIGMPPMLVLPLVGFTGFAIIGVLMVAGALAERVRVMSEYNARSITRGYVAPSERAGPPIAWISRAPGKRRSSAWLP
jgi:hypothetical protein